jgi:RNA polymerase sigma-70 factor (ECF subfamily)
LLVVLQQLSPVERAVFLLREVLDYDYREIASILDKSEANCRKIYSRVKPKIQQEAPYASKPAGDEVGGVVQSFLHASQTGDFGPFVHWLADQAVLINDGGGKRRSARLPILGKVRVRKFLEGIWRKGSLQGELRPVVINGQQGLLLVRGGPAANRDRVWFRSRESYDQNRLFRRQSG